jgi:hypothetical protein
VVQTFCPNRTDHPLHVGSLARRPRCAEYFFNVHEGNLLAKLRAIDTVPIPPQILRCGLEEKRFHNLPRPPFRPRMRRALSISLGDAPIGACFGSLLPGSSCLQNAHKKSRTGAKTDFLTCCRPCLSEISDRLAIGIEHIIGNGRTFRRFISPRVPMPLDDRRELTI